jgi:hypothetical protein
MKGPQNPIIQRLEALKSFDLPRIEKASKPDQFKARASKPFPFEEKSSMQPESSGGQPENKAVTGNVGRFKAGKKGCKAGLNSQLPRVTPSRRSAIAD